MYTQIVVNLLSDNITSETSDKMIEHMVIQTILKMEIEDDIFDYCVESLKVLRNNRK